MLNFSNWFLLNDMWLCEPSNFIHYLGTAKEPDITLSKKSFNWCSNLLKRFIHFFKYVLRKDSYDFLHSLHWRRTKTFINENWIKGRHFLQRMDGEDQFSWIVRFGCKLRSYHLYIVMKVYIYYKNKFVAISFTIVSYDFYF